jgi:signal transduction histidine kinase
MFSFIDMTSHELRNPLSAVVQCAESAINTLEHLQSPLSPTMSPGSNRTNYNEEIESAIDALSTILTCSSHQKRVIDDVLTLSKLDSELIVITPVRVQISVVILEALKMFEVECRQLDIKLDFQEDISIKEFDWMMLDPSRMLQVLINLM